MKCRENMRFPFTFTKLDSIEYYYFMKYLSLVINNAKYFQLFFITSQLKLFNLSRKRKLTAGHKLIVSI